MTHTTLLVLLSAMLMGCGASPPPVSFEAPVASLVPAETPFVWMVASASESDRLAEPLWPARLLHRYVLDGVGIDLLAGDAEQQTGLDLHGDMAIFGLGLRPAALIHIEDEDALLQLLRDVALARPEQLTLLEVDEGLSASIVLGAVHIALTQIGDYVLVTYALGAAAPTLVEPSSPLAADASFRRALRELGPPPIGDRWDTLGYLDTVRLDALLLDAPRPAQLEPGLMELCRSRTAALGQELPFLVGGTVVSEGRGSMRWSARLGPTSSELVRRVLSPLDASYWQLSEGALVALGLRLDLEGLELLGERPESLVRCPGVSALEGALGVIGRGLSATDASQVLGGGVVLTVQGLDASLPWFTKREVVLAIEAKDTGAAAAGLAIVMRGLGAVPQGSEEPGVQTFGLPGGAVRLRLIELEEHVVMALGAVQRETLMQRLSNSPSATPTAALARMDLDPPRLVAALSPMQALFEASGVGSASLRWLVDVLTGLDRAEWALTLRPRAAALEGSWTLR